MDQWIDRQIGCGLGLARGCCKDFFLFSGVYAGVFFNHFTTTVLQVTHPAIVVNALPDHTFIFQTDPFALCRLSASYHVQVSDKRTPIRSFFFFVEYMYVLYLNMNSQDKLFFGPVAYFLQIAPRTRLNGSEICLAPIVLSACASFTCYWKPGSASQSVEKVQKQCRPKAGPASSMGSQVIQVFLRGPEESLETPQR